jgi:hypothetical protein
VHVALLLVCVPLVVLGQGPKKSGEPVPADRRLDTYDIYSAVLDRPSLSHSDNNQRYIVLELSGIPEEKDPRSCIAVPEAYRAAFAEVLQDREQHRKRFLLERAFKIVKPYDLITEDQAAQFRRVLFGLGPTTDDVGLFRGAVDLITLGNVYFDRKRTVAAVYTEAYCGSLCGFSTWRVFVKSDEGTWSEQRWATCATIAAWRTTRSARLSQAFDFVTAR